MEAHLKAMEGAPIMRHPVETLLVGAWSRRHRARLADAVYLELAAVLGVALITTERRLRRFPVVVVVERSGQ